MLEMIDVMTYGERGMQVVMHGYGVKMSHPFARSLLILLVLEFM